MTLKKLISLSLTVCLSLLLSSCMAVGGLLDLTIEAPDYRHTTETIVTDTLIAIGKPRQTIPKHEHSLVLVGNQHSYLIEPTSHNKQLFSDIFSQVDLNSVYINQHSINAKISTSTSCENKHGCGKVEISFIKEKAKLYANEETKIKQLGFNCHEKMKGKTNYLTCNNTVSVGFTVISQVKNFKSLQHTFKKPVRLEIIKEDMFEIKSTGAKIKEGIFYTLYPVALAIDIVTLPIQIPIGLALLSTVNITDAI